MKKIKIQIFAIFFGLIMCLVPKVYAFYRSNVDEILASNFGGFAARQMAMGGTGMMSMDGTALYYNPANLARVPRIEFNLGLSYQKYNELSNSRPLGQSISFEIEESKTNSRLNSIILTIPYPTYRGSLVFGVGVVRSNDFDRISTLYYEENEYSTPEVLTESGGINQWGFGFGFDLSPRLAVGTSVYLYHGRHDINLESNLYQSNVLIEEYQQLLEYKYFGMGARLGLAMQFSKHLGLGLAADLPVTLSVEQDAIENLDGFRSFDYVEYDLKRPFVFSAGISSRFDELTIQADIDYVDWTQLAYGDNFAMELDYNSDFKDFYREVIKYRIGGEYVIASAGLSLRAGYFINPLPYQTDYIDKDRRGYSLGFGFLVDQVMTLDFAYVHGSQTDYSFLEPVNGSVFTNSFELTEKITYKRMYLTASYRF